MSVYVRELATELGSRGHRVDVFTRRHNGTSSAIVEFDENARLIHLEAGGDRDLHKLAIYPHLADFARSMDRHRERERRRYDLVHSHYWLSGWVGRWAQNEWGVPHVAMFHTLGAVKNAVAVGEKEPDLRITAEAELTKTAQRVIAATEGGKEELIRHYQADPGLIRVIPCGVNFDVFQPENKQTARKQIGIEDNEPIVLYVGRIEPIKAIDKILLSLATMRDKGPIKFMVVGGDEQSKGEFRGIQELARKTGIEGSVICAGRVRQEDLSAYYSAADVLVLPSYHETFGLVVLESLACGTPVIATRVGAVENIIRDGETGYVVQHNDPASLAEKIEAVLLGRNGGMATAHSLRASIDAFSWGNVADAVLDDYFTLIADPGPEATEADALPPRTQAAAGL
jgi:D-inositol-3-phosphate glycosyltransferase